MKVGEIPVIYSMNLTSHSVVDLAIDLLPAYITLKVKRKILKGHRSQSFDTFALASKAEFDLLRIRRSEGGYLPDPAFAQYDVIALRQRQNSAKIGLCLRAEGWADMEDHILGRLPGLSISSKFHVGRHKAYSL
jgi:hypothetical protein